MCEPTPEACHVSAALKASWGLGLLAVSTSPSSTHNSTLAMERPLALASTITSSPSTAW